MVYTIEEVQKMLKLWGTYREFDERESIHLGCGSPTYAAMLHAKGHVRQSENCRTVFTPPPPPDYYNLIEQATDALLECPSLQYVVGKDRDKFYTQARLLMSIINRRYKYGMSIRRIGKHVGRVKNNNGKRVGDDTVSRLLEQAEQFICDYLNQRIKVYELVTKKLDETG